MNLDPNKFKGVEINRMVTGFSYPGCPLNRNCFHVALGGPFEPCEFFKSEENQPTAECLKMGEDFDGSKEP